MVLRAGKKISGKKSDKKLGQKNSICGRPMQNGVPPRNCSAPIVLSMFIDERIDPQIASFFAD